MLTIEACPLSPNAIDFALSASYPLSLSSSFPDPCRLMDKYRKFGGPRTRAVNLLLYTCSEGIVCVGVKGEVVYALTQPVSNPNDQRFKLRPREAVWP